MLHKRGNVPKGDLVFDMLQTKGDAVYLNSRMMFPQPIRKVGMCRNPRE